MTDLLTIQEVAQILRVEVGTVRRWINNGALEAVVLPHMNKRMGYRIKREALNNVLSTPAGASK